MKLNLYCFNSWWKNYGDYDDDGDDDDDDDDDDADGDDDDDDDDIDDDGDAERLKFWSAEAKNTAFVSHMCQDVAAPRWNFLPRMFCV